MRKLIWSTAVMIALVIPGVRVWHDIRPAAAAQDHVVKVEDRDRDQLQWKFVPQEVDIAVGDTVTWDMTDAQLPHSATADDGSFNSGNITPGNKWTHTFDKPGEIRYHCEPHPWKKGVIRVK
jgi:plastocyanin